MDQPPPPDGADPARSLTVEVAGARLPPPYAAPLAADPLGWLRGVQLLVGATVRGSGPGRLALDVTQLDRTDAFSVVVELFDLIEGLAAATRLRVVTLSELVAMTAPS